MQREQDLNSWKHNWGLWFKFLVRVIWSSWRNCLCLLCCPHDESNKLQQWNSTQGWQQWGVKLLLPNPVEISDLALWSWTDGNNKKAANNLVSVKSTAKLSFSGAKTWSFSYSDDHLQSSAHLFKYRITTQVLWALMWKETYKVCLQVGVYFSSCTGEGG